MGEEKCSATLVLGADDEKTACTFHCCLPKDHTCDHQERGNSVARDVDEKAIGISYYSMVWANPVKNTQ